MHGHGAVRGWKFPVVPRDRAPGWRSYGAKGKRGGMRLESSQLPKIKMQLEASFPMTVELCVELKR